MHSISHSLAHRGPGASRARSRWQPYTCTSTSTPPALSRSPQTYLHTPTSIVLPPAPSSTYISPAIHLERSRSAHLNIPPKPLPAAGASLREHKYKYVASLVGECQLIDLPRISDSWPRVKVSLTPTLRLRVQIKQSNRFAIFGSPTTFLSFFARRPPIRDWLENRDHLPTNPSFTMPCETCNFLHPSLHPPYRRRSRPLL